MRIIQIPFSKVEPGQVFNGFWRKLTTAHGVKRPYVTAQKPSRLYSFTRDGSTLVTVEVEDQRVGKRDRRDWAMGGGCGRRVGAIVSGMEG